MAPAPVSASIAALAAASAAAREVAASAAAAADDRLLRHLMMNLGPLGVPLPLLTTWRDHRGGS